MEGLKPGDDWAGWLAGMEVQPNRIPMEGLKRIKEPQRILRQCGSTEQNPDGGIETSRSFRLSAPATVQPNRIPMEGLKLWSVRTHLRYGAAVQPNRIPMEGLKPGREFGGRVRLRSSTEQNPDGGIETALRSASRYVYLGSTEQNPDGGIETALLLANQSIPRLFNRTESRWRD